MKYLLIALFFLQCNQIRLSNNGGFETLDASKRPIGWTTPINQKNDNAYLTSIDSAVKVHGKYSMRITKVRSSKLGYGIIDYQINKIYEGKQIQLRGYVRTNNVSKGYAGLWIRLDGIDKTLAVDNMESQRVTGTTEWKQFSIELPYSPDAKTIHLGGYVIGSGTAWFDDLELFIDGKPISQAKLSKPRQAELDTTFVHGSGIKNIILNQQVITNLSTAGEFWGFLKYHHPEVKAGAYDWDAELFRLLPKVIQAKNNAELSHVLEMYLDKLQTPEVCKECEVHVDSNEILKPNYGNLFTGKILNPSLSKKLKFIKTNSIEGENFWVEKGPVGNATFKNEKPYIQMKYDDTGYRLLCLFRFWAIINYFYPYRDGIGESWTDVLIDFVPQFITSSNANDYTLTTLKLIAKIHDTHANIYNSALLEGIKGSFSTSFQANFISGKLVVTENYASYLNSKSKLQVGDIITKIDGQTVDELVKKYLPITPASNYETQLRDLPNSYLLRSKKETMNLEIRRLNKIFNINEHLLHFKKIQAQIASLPKKDHYLIDKNIGYVYAGSYKNSYLEEMKRDFKNTKGLIIDMRGYPPEFMPYTFGNYIKSFRTPFAKISRPDIAKPGAFSYTTTEANGGSVGSETYKGKIVVIVSSKTQSQAEYTTMAFQSSSNVKVIGSKTAGADGNISSILLPGGISTVISGIGIYYPDGKPTQRLGVKIDILVEPTIEGIRAGKDEQLLTAIDILKNQR